MTAPTRAAFAEKAKQGNLIPVWREVLADTETPVSAYRKIAGDAPNSFLIFRSKGETAQTPDAASAAPSARSCAIQ